MQSPGAKATPERNNYEAATRGFSVLERTVVTAEPPLYRTGSVGPRGVLSQSLAHSPCCLKTNFFHLRRPGPLSLGQSHQEHKPCTFLTPHPPAWASVALGRRGALVRVNFVDCRRHARIVLLSCQSRRLLPPPFSGSRQLSDRLTSLQSQRVRQKDNGRAHQGVWVTARP